MFKIKRALISCTDKTDIVELAKELVALNVEILSTGGTAKLLKDNGIAVKDVSEHTGSPEILDGRLKTLHPKIHGGILGIRSNSTHQKEMADNDISDIDLVVVNLYAFEKTIAKDDCSLDDAIENIDIGGPTMLRAAAKNYKDVLVVTDPKDYDKLIAKMKSGDITEADRFHHAVQVFNLTANYDTAIKNYLNKELDRSQKEETVFPIHKHVSLTKIQDLRYGENPHQQATFYREDGATAGIVNAEQLQGKELSFNNILDIESAYNCCKEFSQPACVIVKHLNPCGVAVSASLSDAFKQARAGDPVSSFGGIIALNQKVDSETARMIAETFFEAVLAPDFADDALALFSKKKNMRVMKLKNFSDDQPELDYRRIGGGMLIQDVDKKIIDVATCQVVTKRQPTKEELADLNFAWRVVKHVKSNAIVFAAQTQALGVGAGQMSRVDSVKIATMKAVENFKNKDILKGSVLASDAFFPFRDGLDAAAEFGITAVVQPGGSVRDNEVIEACDEKNIAMIFTGMRHFRH